MIQIHSLTYAPGKSEHVPPYRYNRAPVDQVTLVAGHGIEGDFKAGRNPRRHLNILSLETVNQLAAEGFKTGPGELGEQVVIRGLDVRTLAEGDRLQLGSGAVVEITGLREPCEWFELIQGKPLETAVGRVGVLATVVESGVIRLGDPVRLLMPVAD